MEGSKWSIKRLIFLNNKICSGSVTMKNNRVLMLACCTLLASSVLIGCSSETSTSKPSLEASSTKQSSSDTETASNKQKQEFDTSEYLVIDTSKIEDFELSPLVKEVVGTYSGIIKNNNTKYEIKINRDGTYAMLSYNVSIPYHIATNEVRTYPYLDKADTQVNIPLTWEESGETYGMYNGFTLDRGVLVEKYGQLHYQSISKTAGDTYIDSDGNFDFVKGLVKSEVSGTGKLPDTETGYEAFIENQFSSGDRYVFGEDSVEPYIEGGKLYVGEEELTASTNLSNLITKDLTDLFSKKNLSNLIQSNNDIVQFKTALGNIVADDTISPFTDFDNLYTYSGKKVEADYAVSVSGIRNYMATAFVYVYYNGVIEKAVEQNGKYIIQ